MNTRAMSESRVESQLVVPASTSVARLMYWSVLRELWEYRSIYVAPLIAAALALLGFLIAVVHLPARMRAASAANALQHQTIHSPYTMAALLIMFTTFVVALFYSLDALHGERRDRSILFWKSLPVSDSVTVLSKASIPIVVLPLVTLAITVATQWMMLLISSAVLLGSGIGPATLWNALSLPQTSLMLLYHLIAIHGLWYAPFYAWLLLVSAWSRRAPVLWAILPLLAVGIFEKIAFNTSHFAAIMRYRFLGPEGTAATAGSMSMASLTRLTPGQFLATPGLWLGLALAAAFLAAAVRLRHYRDPVF